ncbi:uncharacterized protein LOC117063646 [Trachypithecus francoisi]|uniref:uncharacterized protein LOC117063646 n=1 Tax=Trachypithecus francoisi TaxID=54180 RepID=UPI00141B58B7|nr:uncharacterized protein LOC117063646 [Trachypithecus francoisi]
MIPGVLTCCGPWFIAGCPPSHLGDRKREGEQSLAAPTWGQEEGGHSGGCGLCPDGAGSHWSSHPRSCSCVRTSGPLILEGSPVRVPSVGYRAALGRGARIALFPPRRRHRARARGSEGGGDPGECAVSPAWTPTWDTWDVRTSCWHRLCLRSQLCQGCCGLLTVHFRSYSSGSLLHLEMSLEEAGKQQRWVPAPSSGIPDLEGHRPDASKNALV